MMLNWTNSKKPDYQLSVIIIFHNMRREAQRTLYSLSNTYQLNMEENSYEVIVIDNGSTEPLNADIVNSFGKNFRYIYYETNSLSPCAAINYGVSLARGNLITICIDGARILSPGILHYSLLASQIYSEPFVYTLGMHIGSKPQNYLVEENYSPSDEDKLMATIEWEKDGYLLFDVSCTALSSGEGYLSTLSESNCITLSKKLFYRVGGFNEKFSSAGGGLTNLDFFNRIHLLKDAIPILLLGEATFHQFHGGTATNVPMKNHPWKKMSEEYYEIYGVPYQIYTTPPIYFGKIHQKCIKLFQVRA